MKYELSQEVVEAPNPCIADAPKPTAQLLTTSVDEAIECIDELGGEPYSRRSESAIVLTAEVKRLRAKLTRVDSEFTKLRDAYYAEDNACCAVRCELVDGVWEALKDNSAG